MTTKKSESKKPKEATIVKKPETSTKTPVLKPKKPAKKSQEELKKERKSKIINAIAWPTFIVAAFFLSNVLVAIVLVVLVKLGVTFDNEAVYSATVSAAVFAVMLAIVLVIPKKVMKIKSDRDSLGLTGLPTWTDILISPVGLIVYFILAALFVSIFSKVFPWFNSEQSQDVGFAAESLTSRLDYVLAFITLVVVAPIAEETTFRGLLYGKLRSSKVNVVIAMLITSIVFSALHGQWNVGVNVFCMSLVMCFMREVTGTIYSSILLHMLKNGLAFYLLYINTGLLGAAAIGGLLL